MNKLEWQACEIEIDDLGSCSAWVIDDTGERRILVSGVDMLLPYPWEPISQDRDDSFVRTLWRNGDLTASVVQGFGGCWLLSCTISNHGLESVNTEFPVLEILTESNPIEWIAGARGFIAVPVFKLGFLTWIQSIGQCEGSAEVGVQPRRIKTGGERLIAPGQDVRVVWRGHWFMSLSDLEQQISPSWMPENLVAPKGTEINVDFIDGLVKCEGVKVIHEYPKLCLLGDPGVSTLELSDARGVTKLKIGWAASLDEVLAQAINNLPDVDSVDDDVAAWLLCRYIASGKQCPDLLDKLDIRIANITENPAPFLIAAAADASLWFGEGLLEDAKIGLESLLSLRKLPLGTGLAGTRLYAAARIAGLSWANKLADKLITRGIDGGCLDLQIFSGAGDIEQIAWRLSTRLGFGLPSSTSWLGKGSVVALLRETVELVSPEQLPENVHEIINRATNWILAERPSLRDLSWLLW